MGLVLPFNAPLHVGRGQQAFVGAGVRMDNGSERDWSEENTGVQETGRRFPEELVPGLFWGWVVPTPTSHWLLHLVLHRLRLYWPRRHVMVAGWNWPVVPPPAPNVTLHYRPRPGLHEGQGVGAQGALQP